MVKVRVRNDMMIRLDQSVIITQLLIVPNYGSLVVDLIGELSSSELGIDLYSTLTAEYCTAAL